MANRVELSQVLRDLRAELQQAADEGKDEELRFLLTDIEVELSFSVGVTDSGGVGVKFWVLSGEAKTSASSQSAHRIRLSIKPESPTGDPLKLAEPTSRPA
jgi:hypothetical protein